MTNSKELSDFPGEGPPRGEVRAGVEFLGQRESSYTVDFSNIRKKDLNLVGGKALRLALMSQAGVLIPEGFCITTKAYRDYLGFKGERDEYGLPPSLTETLALIYQKRGLDQTPIAVRSSATAEDLAQASSAGVYSTRLNVSNEKEFLEAVGSCFASMRTSEANGYRDDMGLGNHHAMAVVVQKMVDADVSGVIFTAHPVTGNDNKIVVNSIDGLGEPLVNGKVTGDSCILARDGEVLDQSSGTQQFSLNREQLRVILEKAIRVEELFGEGQDIEFAIEGAQVFILQSRPITGLKAECEEEGQLIEAYRLKQIEKLKQTIVTLRQADRLTGTEAIYTISNFSELLPRPTPMSFDIFRYIFTDNGGIQIGRRQMGYQLGSTTDKGMIAFAFGQVLTNLEIDARTFDIGVPQDVEGYIEAVKADPERALYPELGLYEQTPSLAQLQERFGEEKGKEYYQVYQKFMEGIGASEQAYAGEFENSIEPGLRAFLEDHRAVDIDQLNPMGLIEYAHGILEHLRTKSCVEFVVAARLGFFATDRLQNYLGQLGIENPGQVLQDLLSGLPPSRITQEAFDLQKVLDGKMTREQFAAFYGHFGSNELEISVPRRHEIGIDAYLDGISVREVNAMVTQIHAQGEKRRQAEDVFLQVLESSVLSEEEKQEAVNALAAAQRYLSLRETVKYYFTAEYDLLRQSLLQLARRGEIEEADVFFLMVDELPLVFSDKDNALKMIAFRQKEYDLARQLGPLLPSVIFEYELDNLGLAEILEYRSEHEGEGVSSGQSTGRVVHVDPDKLDVPSLLDDIEKTDGQVVLCSRSANLGMDPLIRQSNGLILEIGGLLAHGACRAREAGVPAVVLNRARELIPDGSIVFVDGALGTIRIISNPEEEGNSGK